MSINSQKFLPPSKGGTLAKVNKAIIKSSSPISLSRKSLEDLSVIKVKVIEIDSILKGTLASEKKKLNDEKKQESSKRREKIEEKLETKPKAESGKVKTLSLPKMGFLDWVKNFIGNVILGYFVIRLVDHLPKIIPIVKFLGQATDFVINVGSKLLDGLVTFIDWGYKAYDATRGFVKNLFGNDGVKQFDQLSSALNQFLNLAIIAGMAVAGSGGFGGKGGKGGKGVGGSTRPRPGSRGRPRVTTSGGGSASRPDIRNPLRQKPKVTTSGGGNKGLLRTVRPFLKRIPLPVVGALIDFGLSVALGENPGRAAFRAIGAGLLGTIGGGLAGALGLVGGPLAVATGALGAIAGGTLGDMAGGAIYDLFFGSKKPTGKTVKKAGGGITRGGKSQGGAKRTISSNRKGKYKRVLAPRKPDKVEIKPGSDVGGEDKILGLFPNPLKAAQRAIDVINPFKVVKTAGEDLGNTDYFGPILAITSKILLGQKPTPKDYNNVGLGINMLISKGINDGKLRGGLAAFAEGGFVDPKTLNAISQGGDISDWVAKSFKDATETNAQKTLREIQDNLRLKKDQGVDQDKGIDQKPDPNLDVDGGGFNVTGGNADFWALVAIASLESGTPQGRADVAQSIYNRLASGVYEGKTIKELVVSGNGRQYQPVERAVREFRSISDKQSAINAVMVANKLSRGQAEKFINDTASAVQNKELQKNAAQFIGGRTDFWAQGLTPPSNGIGYVVRHGHRFGWFVGPAAIAYGRKNPGPAKAPQLGDIAVMGADAKGSMVSLKGGKAFPLPKGMIGSNSDQVYGAPRGYGGHAGVDVVEKQPWGSNPRLPIVAYSGGKVLSEKFVPNDPYLSGLMIDHGGVQTRYLHATPNVRPGQTVQPGQKIGNLLNLGNQTHLHFESYKGSQRLNPTSMLQSAYEKGGLTLGRPHMAMLGEKGKEFVIDADSTAAIEQTFPGFLGAINKAKYKDAINVLSNFASYESGADQTIVIPEIQVNNMGNESDYSSGSSSLIMVSGDESDPFDSLYIGG